MLQARLRGVLARRKWRRQRAAVVLLQAHTRGALARRAARKMKRDVRSENSAQLFKSLTQFSKNFIVNVNLFVNCIHN